MRYVICLLAAGLTIAFLFAQTSNDPFASPIAGDFDAIVVDVVEFATVPDSDGRPARMMHVTVEPDTHRLFVSDMRGLLYRLSDDGRHVDLYLDLDAPAWGVDVEASRGERGFQSLAFHPQFARAGSPGFGKLYTLTDTANTAPVADFTPGGGNDSHDTVLLEWTAATPDAATYDGGPPRELVRFEQPFGNHNGGDLAFNPLAGPGEPDFGLLYVGSADGGSGGDPLGLAQSLDSAFGKILRIDPLGTTSANGRYGIPRDNPFASDGNDATLGEIYALGLRNPQRFSWDPETGTMFVADIGQNIVEEVSTVAAGANLGWNAWEGSYGFISRRAVNLADPRGDPAMTYPIVEYGQLDPLLQRSSAVTGVYVYRSDAIPQLSNLLLFGDNPSGEVFAVPADDLPQGGQHAIRRILFNHGGEAKTLLELIRAKNVDQRREPATRADLRFDVMPDGRIFVLNKSDGTIRLVVAASH